MVGTSDATGETALLDYDENSNPVRLERRGPDLGPAEEPFHAVIVQQFDALDRMVSGTLNQEPPETWSHNALGQVTTHSNSAGVKTQFLHDGFARQAGQAVPAILPGATTGQMLIERIDWDDNNRVTARTNAAGHQTQYQYDVLNRRSAIIYPDGNSRHFERDANGNIAGIRDPDGNTVVQQFDPINRLVERQIQPPNTGNPQVEHFHYNGLNRLAAAVTGGVAVARHFDSLSRLLAEAQPNGTVQYAYDGAGNRTHVAYPGGQQIRKTYDVLNRVSEVRDGQDNLIAQYTYRSSRQRRHQKLGNVLEATYSYLPSKLRLESVQYRSIQDGHIIEGNQYSYDEAGDRTQEFQLSGGPAFGERYLYDSAGRLVDVRYGVQDLADPNSSFQVQVCAMHISHWAIAISRMMRTATAWSMRTLRESALTSVIPTIMLTALSVPNARLRMAA